jgi:WD40 repeat protein
MAALRPGTQPFYSLAGALLPLLEPKLSETDRLTETRKLAEVLTNGEVHLAEVARRIMDKTPGTRQVLFIVDQFEELYTLCSDAQLQKSFIDELLATVEASRNSKSDLAVIVLTMRADFMGQALAHRPFADALQEASVLMGPMTRNELHMAIEKPAEMQGAALEPGLVERILDDVGEKPGNLPLLEFTLTQLWERQSDGWLTHADYEAMGCLEGALATYADQVYTDLDENEQELARHAFVQLVQPGEGTEDTRRIATHEELGDESWKLIQHLADKRLVVTGRDAQGREIAEVVHEALIQRWGKFHAWMNADRAFRAWQERLRGSLRQWQESGQDEGALLAGAPLAVAQDWLTERHGELSTTEINYIQASQALQIRQQKERQRRRQWTIIGLTAGLLVAIILTAFALVQRQAAVTQRQISLHQASIGLASQAQLELQGTYPERSVLLALEALTNYPYTWQAEQALGQIVREFRLRKILTGHTDMVLDVAWSPDGTKIATSGNDGTLRIWDAQTHIELRKISAHPATVAFDLGVQKLAWSSQGDRIATAGIDGTTKIWDTNSGKEIATFSGHTDEVWGVTWSPNGAWVASASKDGTAKVWNALTGDESLTLSGHTAGLKSVTWSPDGTRLATAGDDNTARIWDATTGEELLKLTGHTNWVWCVTWSPDGFQLATASEDGTVRLWNASTGSQLSDIRLASPVWQAAWSPDGQQLATTSADGQAQVWDVSTGAEAFSLQGRIPERFNIAWSPDGKSLATTMGAGFSVRLWDAMPAALTLSDTDGAIGWVKWSPDGSRIATTNYLSGTIVIWDPQTSEAILTIDSGASTGNLQDVFWSPDSSQIVTTDWVMLAKVWDANTGQLLLTFNGHVGEPKSKFQVGDSLFGGGWSPDGSRISTMGGWGRERVWDAHTGEEILSFQVTNDIGTPGRWSPDGKRLATCAIPQVLQIWNAETGDPILGGYVNNTEDSSFGDSMDWCFGPEWSPDGSHLLTTSFGGNGATIWNANTGESTLIFSEHSGGLVLPTWSPNGERVATGDTSGVIKIWDPDTGAVLLSYSVPIADFLYQLDWSPDGTLLVGTGLLSSLELHRVWQSTKEERTQFGLP